MNDNTNSTETEKIQSTQRHGDPFPRLTEHIRDWWVEIKQKFDWLQEIKRHEPVPNKDERASDKKDETSDQDKPASDKKGETSDEYKTIRNTDDPETKAKNVFAQINEVAGYREIASDPKRINEVSDIFDLATQTHGDIIRKALAEFWRIESTFSDDWSKPKFRFGSVVARPGIRLSEISEFAVNHKIKLDPSNCRLRNLMAEKSLSDLDIREKQFALNVLHDTGAQQIVTAIFERYKCCPGGSESDDNSKFALSQDEEIKDWRNRIERELAEQSVRWMKNLLQILPPKFETDTYISDLYEALSAHCDGRAEAVDGCLKTRRRAIESENLDKLISNLWGKEELQNLKSASFDFDRIDSPSADRICQLLKLAEEFEAVDQTFGSGSKGSMFVDLCRSMCEPGLSTAATSKGERRFADHQLKRVSNSLAGVIHMHYGITASERQFGIKTSESVAQWRNRIESAIADCVKPRLKDLNKKLASVDPLPKNLTAIAAQLEKAVAGKDRNSLLDATLAVKESKEIVEFLEKQELDESKTKAE